MTTANSQVGQNYPTSRPGQPGQAGLKPQIPPFAELGPERVGEVGRGGSPLKGGTPRQSYPGLPALSPCQVEASKVWASAYEHHQNPSAPVHSRMWASDTRRLGLRRLTAPEVAILDMVAGKGSSLAYLSAQTGRRLADLSNLYLGATRKLATALEAQAAAGEVR